MGHGIVVKSWGKSFDIGML